MSDLNIKSSTIEKGLDLASGFAKQLLGPLVEELGLYFADGLKLRRAKNIAVIFEKIKKECEEKNIPIKQLNLKVIHPFLENASLEEDEDLQDTWTNLMVNYLDSTKNLTSTVYPSILAQLSTEDLKLLNDTYNINPGGEVTISPYDGQSANIERLGLLKLHSTTVIQETDFIARHAASVSITEFGRLFIAACRRD